MRLRNWIRSYKARVLGKEKIGRKSSKARKRKDYPHAPPDRYFIAQRKGRDKTEQVKMF